MRYLIVLCCAAMLAGKANGQAVCKIKVTDSATNQPLTGVSINEGGKTKGITDINGLSTVTLGDGHHSISASYIGYNGKTISLRPTDTLVTILLSPDNSSLEELTIVASTRGKQNIESSPLKVEVLGKEELNEEVGIKPGNIASILGDVSGVQIQQSSANTANSNVRIQGLPGRYTQIVRDGMPLYDNFSGGLGILSIPPLDLRQIELIKGSASTIYGGGAIAGLINLLSRKPSYQQEADVLVNYSTLSEMNVNAFAARRFKKVGYTLFAGYTQQNAKDVNGDSLSDVPQLHTINVHPKLFFYPSDKTIISVGYSLTADERKGGDMRVFSNNIADSHYYYEGIRSTRNLAEYSIDQFFTGDMHLTIKGLLSFADRTNDYTSYSLHGKQINYYNEASLYKPYKHAELVLGVNATGDQFRSPATDSTIIHFLSNTTYGAFGQYTWHPTEKTTIEGGLRVDHHNLYGFFPLPRVAMFHHINNHWGIRAGFGMGYKTANPFAPQDYEIDQRTIKMPGEYVKGETSYGANLEVNYKKEWDKQHSLFINQAFYYTRIKNQIMPIYDNNYVYIMNIGLPLQTSGFDTYVKLKLDEIELYAGYTFTNARNSIYPDEMVPLTSKHRAAFVVSWEPTEQWRLGLEGSYTGPQRRYYGDMTPGYTFVALMAQRKLGKHVYIVANCENLLDYRMSNVETLYYGTIKSPTFKPLWAPIDGRVINVSLRWKL